MGRLRKVNGERNLYQDPHSGTYYIRVYHQCRDTYRSLETSRISEARERIDQRRAAKAAAKLGLALEPDESRRASTVREVVTSYEKSDFPDRRGRPRPDSSHKRGERDNCATLLKFFGDETLVDDLRPKTLDDYHTWRTKTVIKGEGHRTTDLELNTLNNALNLAVRQELIRSNPISVRTRYHSATEARHCKDLAPSDVDELHSIARLLFERVHAEALGWQALFEGLTGLRTNEALALRMNARPDEPGGLTEDKGSLCVRRIKRSGRDNSYVEVHEGLRRLMEAHKRWHTERFPNSPWYFPGRDNEGAKPVDDSALTKALEYLFSDEELRKSGKALRKKFISHGMRAFYVRVRRSHGISDTQIAWEVNHVGGVATLEKVYGTVPPHWCQGKGPKLSWLPKGKPAWSQLVPGQNAPKKQKPAARKK